jgi:alkylation response protein AidB-like acyl-CoA dehydrogenase
MTEPRYKNLSYFLLDMKQPGITFRTIKQLAGSSHFAEVFLDDAFVADEDRVDVEGAGWKVAMTTLTAERGGIEAITRYVEIRGDVDILSGCCIKGSGREADAAELDTRIELVRWQVMKALDFEDNPEELFKRTCMLKVMWSDIWQDVTSLALAHSCVAHEAHWRNQYLETRAATIYSGSNEIQRNIIGDRVLGLPR